MARRVGATLALCGTVMLLGLLQGYTQQRVKEKKGVVTLNMAVTPSTSEKSEKSEIAWETSLAKAQARAKKEGKPLFVLQLFGKLNDALC